MCMCMSPRARWKMVHRSYLYVLSVSVMQAGVTCTSFLSTQLESVDYCIAMAMHSMYIDVCTSYTTLRCDA